MSANIKTARQRMSAEALLDWDSEDFTPPIVIALEEEIADLRAALAAKDVPDGWISVKDLLPPPNTGVLVTNGEIVTAAELDYVDGKPWYWDCHGVNGYDYSLKFRNFFTDGEVTHWMPLPAAPSPAEQEKP